MPLAPFKTQRKVVVVFMLLYQALAGKKGSGVLVVLV